MVALKARDPTLIIFNAGELHDFMVKLPDLPVHATRVLGDIHEILIQVVGDEPVRAVCRHRDENSFTLYIFGNPLILMVLPCAKSAGRHVSVVTR